MYITARAAYGRTYKSAKAVKADFAAGLDFQIDNFGHPDDGRYVNKGDLPKGDHLSVRYNDDRSSVNLP